MALLLAFLFFMSCDSELSGSIDSSREAVLRSLIYIGAGEAELRSNFSVDTSVVSLSDDDTPFLRHHTESARFWRVTFDGIDLVGDYDADGEAMIPRLCTVLIDSLTGDLYKIEFVGAAMEPHETGVLTVEAAENQLQRSGEVYAGYRGVVPGVGFRKACGILLLAMMSAKKVEALYVSYRLRDREPFPAWVITLSGLPEDVWGSPHGMGLGSVEGLPPCQFDHIRYIINGRTGKRLMSSTRPQYPLFDGEPPAVLDWNEVDAKCRTAMGRVIPCDLDDEKPRVIQRQIDPAGWISEDEAPFLSNLLESCSTVIELNLLACEFCRDSLLAISAEAGELRSAKAYFRSDNGMLVKAVFERDLLDDTCYVELTSKEAERQLQESGESYLPLHDSVPTSLFTALRGGMRYTLRSNKTIVQLVNWKQSYGPDRPVWILQSIGIDPPLEPRGGDRGRYPIYQYTRIRQVVNARTGMILMSDTEPVVHLKPKDRERLFPGTSQ